MDDFNAELLKSWEESAQDMADTHDRLRGATVEYQQNRVYRQRNEHEYILRGVLSRLMAVYQESIDEVVCDEEQKYRYDVVVLELINTLTSYLSQG